MEIDSVDMSRYAIYLESKTDRRHMTPRQSVYIWWPDKLSKHTGVILMKSAFFKY